MTPGTVLHFKAGRCNDRWRLLVSAYSDNEVSANDAELARAHLSACRDCQIYLVDTRRMDALAKVALGPFHVPTRRVAMLTFVALAVLALALVKLCL